MPGQSLQPDLALCYAVADVLASITQPKRFAAVFVGGVGTDWERAISYPYAVIRVESAEQPRGGVTRTVRVRIVSRVSDVAAPAKPEPVEGARPRVFEIGSLLTLFNLVHGVREALSAADLGAPLESIATEYDAESQFPVQTADLVLSFADAQAFGDAF